MFFKEIGTMLAGSTLLEHPIPARLLVAVSLGMVSMVEPQNIYLSSFSFFLCSISDGFQPTSVGLQPTSDGLQPASDWKIAALDYKETIGNPSIPCHSTTFHRHTHPTIAQHAGQARLVPTQTPSRMKTVIIYIYVV